VSSANNFVSLITFSWEQKKTKGKFVKSLEKKVMVSGKSIISSPMIWNGLDTGMACNGGLFAHLMNSQ